MHGLLKTRFADRWLWLCPALGVLLAAVVLMLFDFNVWSALLAALLLVCPAMLLWGAIEVMLDERRQRAALKKKPNASASTRSWSSTGSDRSRAAAVYALGHVPGRGSRALQWHDNARGVDFSVTAGRFRGDEVIGLDLAGQIGSPQSP